MMRFRSSGNNRSGTARFLALWMLVGLVALLPESAWGQLSTRSPSKFYPDSSDPAEKVLRNAAGHARDAQWAHAVELYQRVIDQFGGKVAKVPKDEPGQDASGDFVLFVDARRFCHQALAHFPPEAREIYRNRVDAVAERWFRQGSSNHDEALLRRVVEQAFCCSWGDDAIELLGDMAFQDGRFGEALGLYRLLVPDRSDDAFALVHPDPTVDLAKVAAKKLLCQGALGENVPTEADLAEFGRRFPGAAGALAGRTGEYATIVAEALAADHLGPPPSQPDNRWPSFAGSQRRSKIVAGPIDVGSTQWRVELEKVAAGRTPPTFGGARMIGGTTPNPPERLLAFHPIILGDQVIVTDGARVLAYNLNDRPIGAEGSAIRSVEPAWKHERDSTASGPQATRYSTGVPRYTLTAVGNRIYARMGGMTATFFSRMEGFQSRGANSIIALDWSTQGKLLWEQKSTSIVLPNRPPDRNGSRSVSFEGTPVADARNVYVALTDRSTQIATYVACYEAETGAPRWIRYLGSASADANNFPAFGMGFQFGAGAGDYNHRLLSLDGPTLYYQTNLGAVVALEAETGNTLWVATYPRSEPTHLAAGGSERDLNPAVVDDGRVFVAPSDSSTIFAFDAANGRLCWKSDPISDEVKLAHLLGVAKGRLVATGNRVLLFDVKTGKLVHAWPDSGTLDGYGRGLLAGDLIYWPTKNEIQVLDQQTGLLAQPPIRLQETYHQKGGNLAAGDGYLIVAQVDGLVVFCQNSRLIERFRDAIVRAPEDASNYFRLAKAAEALGRDQDALASYREAARRARRDQTIDGVPLAASARDHLFRLLVRLAGEARKARRWQECVERLESASFAARSDPDRLQSELLLADVLIEAGRIKDAVAICGRVLADDRLRPLAVVTPDGHRTVRADLFITDRLQSIVRTSGRSTYATYDQEAGQMFERGKKEGDSRTLDLVCRRYPVARIVPLALSELGSLYQASGRMVEATHAYKRLLALAADDQARALAVWNLARVYESRKLYLSARDAYAELLVRYPRAHLPDAALGKTVAEVVPAELARPPYLLLEGDRLQPPLPVPLFRRWQWQPAVSQEVRALCAGGVAPSLDASRLLLVEREGLRLLDPQTGSPRWFSDTGLPIVWAAYSADKIVVASPREIVALELAQGSVIWRYGEASRGKGPARPDPFATPRTDEKNDHDSAPRSRDFLHDLQVAKGRLFFLRGQHDLVALDVDTGAVDWTFSSPPREINEKLTIGDDRIWMQVDKPNELLVLRTDDGQMLSRHSLGENEFLRRPPVPVDEDSVILVPDLLSVKKFDTRGGQATWIYRESDNLPVNGAPRVFSDGERVLVLHDGWQLSRLDPTTGSKRWSCPLGIEDLSERPGAMAFDDKRFYCAPGKVPRASSGKILRAISLEDGSPVWSCHLSGPEEATWSIALTAEHVLAYPGKIDATQGGEIDNMCVIVRRKDTGALVQRFVFPTTIADVAFKVDPRGVWIATARGLWALGQRERGSAPLSARSGR